MIAVTSHERPAEPSTASADAAPSLEAVLDVLPQTQCTKCGYDGCLPYAQAMITGAAPINRCPPGGRAGIELLARVLVRQPMPLDATCGTEAPRRVAWIDEAQCIGCTLCIQACPVDAIAGANKRMHTIMASLCTGCDLCVAPCPVDCIVMRDAQPNGMPVPVWTPADAKAARQRYNARTERLAREHAANEQRLEAKAVAKLAEFDAKTEPVTPQDLRKRATIEAALARARARATQSS